ncbi:hypothetical protein [Asaccharospora irregularis]|uniref:Uncharacterized protein n=1 Tax=Asaccharospora irregularis DSM 2635 TaxID=1121321 RepID=A0A1M5KTD9_9FIRM|nr:hypothetical protein [Asaccharospora irregularis]SHG56051.1 hypothetical protein SAMN04488530_103109 [Asaccharospora irregularis DSM 2635]
MLDTVEFILKILFFILSIIWAEKIIVLRTDKQIVINPLLILISSILVMLTQGHGREFLGVDVQYIRIALYSIYSFIVLLGLYSINKKNGFF